VVSGEKEGGVRGSVTVREGITIMLDNNEEMLQSMVTQGIKANVVTYNTLVVVGGWRKKGLLDKAVEMLDRVVSQGLEPNIRPSNKRVNKKSIY
jgi:pentatricopeptide repeat protein